MYHSGLTYDVAQCELWVTVPSYTLLLFALLLYFFLNFNFKGDPLVDENRILIGLLAWRGQVTIKIDTGKNSCT